MSVLKAILFVGCLIASAAGVHGQALPTTTKTASPPPAVKIPFSNYSITKPCAGMATIPVWTRGTTVNIAWSGGPPGPVKILLVDYCGWVVHSTIATLGTNVHTYAWTIPSALACGIYCVYVQNNSGPLAFWTYSCNFAVTKL